MKDKKLDWIFTPEPERYSLRGDPCLWGEMKEKCRSIQGDRSVDELKRLLYSLFFDLTGYALHEGEIIYIKRYDPGHGMSSGLISMSYWIYIVIPLLLKRFGEGNSPSLAEEKFIESRWAENTEKLKNEKYPSRE
jgi:hypothetical protein